jgi:hypothetical protein
MALPGRTPHYQPARPGKLPAAEGRGGGEGVDSPRIAAQRRQLRSIFGDAAALHGGEQSQAPRHLVYDAGMPAHGAAQAGAAQLEQKQYVVTEGKGTLQSAEDDTTSREGWLFYGLGDEDFVWVLKKDRAQFEKEYPEASLYSGADSDDSVAEGEERKEKSKESKETEPDTGGEALNLPFEQRLVLSIHVRQESKGDHQYVIVCVAGGENLKIELGTGGHSIKRGNEISPNFGTPVSEYEPNSGLTAGQVVQHFETMKGKVQFHFTDYNCVRYASDFVSELGKKKGRDEVDDLFA